MGAWGNGGMAKRGDLDAALLAGLARLTRAARMSRAAHLAQLARVAHLRKRRAQRNPRTRRALHTWRPWRTVAGPALTRSRALRNPSDGSARCATFQISC